VKVNLVPYRRDEIMKNLPNTLLCLLTPLLFTACGERAETEDTWTPIPIAELDAGAKAQYARAESAKGEMFGELMTALMGAIGESGPAGAIGVCNEKAPGIAASVSERLELKIGRTSWKLRNSGNTAPAWSETLLNDRPAEPCATVSSAGHLGVTLPIQVSAPCLTCHGAKESLAPDVRDAIASRYPDDQATGFQNGDLRGWFWVEVPPAGK